MLRRHAHWPGADVPMTIYEGPGFGTVRQLFADRQGSIAAIADHNGVRVAVNSYDEYGIPGAGNTGRFQYTGQVWLAELGMYHYKARIYSPTLGRFLQTDPIGYEDQFNLYTYVGNDPVNATDPSGEATCTGSRIPCPDGGLTRSASGTSSEGPSRGGSRNLLMPLPHGDCDTRAQCDFARDEAATLRGDMSPEVFLDRMKWRGIGALAGALPFAPVLFTPEVAGAVSGRQAAGMLPSGMTPSAMGQIAGFPTGISASREALRQGLPRLASGVRTAFRQLRQAGVSRGAVRLYAQFYRQVARNDPSNFAAIFRSRVLGWLRWIY